MAQVSRGKSECKKSFAPAGDRNQGGFRFDFAPPSPIETPMHAVRWTSALILLGMAGGLPLPAAPQSFRVATYNLENYLDQPAGTRPAKSTEGKAKILESLRTLNADVVALQEMGSTNALLELRSSLTCSEAILWMSSCMMTVFPTHAPPKSPTFPHLSIGQIRSMTLIPVSKSSVFVESSSNFGDAR